MQAEPKQDQTQGKRVANVYFFHWYTQSRRAEEKTKQPKNFFFPKERHQKSQRGIHTMDQSNKYATEQRHTNWETSIFSTLRP